MRYSALKEDIDIIKNIQSEYTDQLNEIFKDYTLSIEEWANKIGCKLINDIAQYSVDFIIEAYTRSIVKVRDNSDSDSCTFNKVSKYCCASDLSMSDSNELHRFVFACLLNLNTNEMKLLSKEEYILDDSIIEEFKNIASMFYGKINYLYDDTSNKIKEAENSNVLVKPLDYYIEISNRIIENYFKDQNNVYHKLIAWLNNNKNKMKQITEEYISQNNINNSADFINKLMNNAVEEMNELPPAVSDIKVGRDLNNTGDKDDNSINKGTNVKKFANKVAKSASKIGDTLISIADKYCTPELSLKIGDATIKGTKPSILGIVGRGLKGLGDAAQIWTDDSDRANDKNELSKGAKSNESRDKQTSGTNEINMQKKDSNEVTNSFKQISKLDVLDNLNKEITKELNLSEFNSSSSSISNINYEDINQKIGTIVYNNPSYQQILGLSDAKLVKLGLADDYKKITGRDISQTPISFSPYMYNGNNFNFPELKVKNEQIDDLNKKIDKSTELNTINYDKLKNEISEIKNKNNEYKRNIFNGKSEPYDGLISIKKDGEISKLTEAITGLTNSIKAPNLLANRDGKYNEETMSKIFDAIEKNNSSINDAIKSFTNKSYGYSSNKDDAFDVNNYEDLNYALKNRLKFRPNNIYAQKFAKAKDFGTDTNNINILSLLKGAIKGVLNVGVTLALSTVSLPVGIIYGIGSMASAVATAPRDEYKEMLDTIGPETTDSFINDYEYDQEKEEYNYINNS